MFKGTFAHQYHVSAEQQIKLIVMSTYLRFATGNTDNGYIRISKKGHNSGTLWPSLTKLIYTSYGSCVASFIQMTWKLLEEFETQHFNNRPTTQSADSSIHHTPH